MSQERNEESYISLGTDFAPEVGDSLVKSNIKTEMTESTIRTTLGKRRVKRQEKYLYFMLAGLLSLTPVFISFAAADVMDGLYKGYNYSFYCVMPQYVSIPFVLLIIKLFDMLNISMTIKVIFSYIGLLIGLVAVPVYTFSAEVSTFSKLPPD